MNKRIHKKIEIQIRSTFNCREIESIIMSFFEYQAQNRGYKFGELTLLHFDMFNGEYDDIISVAAAIEILALATDILDDLQDDDNPETPWQEIDEAIVLNITPALFLLSKKILDQLDLPNYPEINEVFYYSIFQSMIGQHSDLTNDCNSIEDYFNVVIKKSTSLVALSCLLGTIMANANMKQQSIIKQLGEKIGLIAQLKNDLNDLYTWDKKSDFRQKKRTLPILYMLEIDESSIIRDYYLSTNSFESIKDQRNDVFREMEKLGAMHYTKAMIELNKIEASGLIHQLEIPHKYKEKLKQFI